MSTAVVSSSRIVPVAEALPLLTVLAVIVNCSSPSSIVSSVEFTSTVIPVCPAGITTVIFVSV